MKTNGNGFYTSNDPELNAEAERLRQEWRKSHNSKTNRLDDTAGDPIPDLGERDFGAENLDPTKIEPREWILGNWFCREFCSSLIGLGAGGKTAFRIACALAITANRPDIVGEHLFDRVPVLYVCFEDSKKELDRRILAAMKHHKVNNAEIAGYLWVKTIKRLKFVTKEDFKLTIGPLYDMLKAAVLRRSIGLLILDPFIKTHSVDENSNTEMDMVAELIGDLTQDCNTAVDIPQHVHKGGFQPGDAEAGRGASATKDAGRLGYTLCAMDPSSEAAKFSIDPGEARAYFRIDSAKVNIATPEAAKWFKLVGVELGNTADPRYPKGDNVQTIEVWKPPSLFSPENLPLNLIADIFAQLRSPPAKGENWRPDRRTNDLWAGWPICQITGKAKGEADRILKAWIDTGVLNEDEYDSPRRKHTVTMVRLNELKASEILAAYHQPQQPE